MNNAKPPNPEFHAGQNKPNIVQRVKDLEAENANLRAQLVAVDQSELEAWAQLAILATALAELADTVRKDYPYIYRDAVAAVANLPAEAEAMLKRLETAEKLYSNLADPETGDDDVWDFAVEFEESYRKARGQ